MDREQFQKAYAKVVANAWVDDAFKQRLLSDPTTVFKENGVDVPEGVKFKLVESTSALVYLVLPPKPDSVDTDADDLERRQASYYSGYSTCAGCF